MDDMESIYDYEEDLIDTDDEDALLEENDDDTDVLDIANNETFSERESKNDFALPEKEEKIENTRKVIKLEFEPSSHVEQKQEPIVKPKGQVVNKNLNRNGGFNNKRFEQNRPQNYKLPAKRKHPNQQPKYKQPPPRMYPYPWSTDVFPDQRLNNKPPTPRICPWSSGITPGISVVPQVQYQPLPTPFQIQVPMQTIQAQLPTTSNLFLDQNCVPNNSCYIPQQATKVYNKSYVPNQAYDNSSAPNLNFSPPLAVPDKINNNFKISNVSKNVNNDVKVEYKPTSKILLNKNKEEEDEGRTNDLYLELIEKQKELRDQMFLFKEERRKLKQLQSMSEEKVELSSKNFSNSYQLPGNKMNKQKLPPKKDLQNQKMNQQRSNWVNAATTPNRFANSNNVVQKKINFSTEPRNSQQNKTATVTRNVNNRAINSNNNAVFKKQPNFSSERRSFQQNASTSRNSNFFKDRIVTPAGKSGTKIIVQNIF